VSGSKQSAANDKLELPSASGPHSVEEALEQAYHARSDGHLDAAEVLFRFVLKEDPQNAEAQKALHKLLKAQKSPAKGSRHKNKPARKARLAKAGSQPIPEVASPQPAKAEIDALISLYSAGQLGEAEIQARRLSKKHPRTLGVLGVLSAALLDQGKFGEAVLILRQVLELQPDHAVAHNNLGNAFKNLGRLEEAVACYRQALKFSPDLADVHNNLGSALSHLGKLDEAIGSFMQALKLKDDYVEVYNNLGIVFNKLGKRREASTCYRKALEIKPDYRLALINFASVVRDFETMDMSQEFRQLIVRCLRDPDIDSTNVSAVGTISLLSDLQNVPDTASEDLDGLGILASTAGDLLPSYLKSALVKNPDIERDLTTTRLTLLKRCDEPSPEGISTDVDMELLEALALQGFLNEYIWHVTDDEEQAVNRLESRVVDAIEGGNNPVSAELFLLAAYRPLFPIQSIRQWTLDNYEKTDPVLKPVLLQLILLPALEAEIRGSLEQITPIENDVSSAVRDQYEENPYPRWDSLSFVPPTIYTTQVLDDIAPYRPEIYPAAENPKVLIAGCGTGKQPIFVAMRMQGSDVLAVDLSLTSLAFAKRKADELQVQNIRFAHADILKLGVLSDRFDVIECGGVLHHMADPEAGLRVLVGLLKPGGFMKIGLYSEIAREHIRHWRRSVSEKKFSSSLQGMREFRSWVQESESDEAKLLQKSNDFYSSSTLRDLVFHVQEHQFTLPQISALLGKHDLDFLGFIFSNTGYKVEYAKAYPNDPDCTDLENWHLFEQDNPNLFLGMYQFWCRKESEEI
jgi:tetratricopeptide (TPR) repeat protein/ubiquinone/menaquinone biosynthesis C-methylase UbiE